MRFFATHPKRPPLKYLSIFLTQQFSYVSHHHSKDHVLCIFCPILSQTFHCRENFSVHNNYNQYESVHFGKIWKKGLVYINKTFLFFLDIFSLKNVFINLPFLVKTCEVKISSYLFIFYTVTQLSSDQFLNQCGHWGRHQRK